MHYQVDQALSFELNGRLSSGGWCRAPPPPRRPRLQLGGGAPCPPSFRWLPRALLPQHTYYVDPRHSSVDAPGSFLREGGWGDEDEEWPPWRAPLATFGKKEGECLEWGGTAADCAWRDVMVVLRSVAGEAVVRLKRSPERLCRTGAQGRALATRGFMPYRRHGEPARQQALLPRVPRV